MAIDPTRAIFAKREYRYIERSDPAVLAKYPAAVEVEIPANLSEASATALADAILAAAKNPAMAFETTIEQLIYLDDLDGSPPTFQVYADEYAATGRVVRVEEIQTDWLNNTTTLLVRG